MKKSYGFAGIEILIALLIIAFLFLYFTGNLFDNKMQKTDENTDFNVNKEKINKQINEVQKQRQDNLIEQQRRLDELNNSY